MEIIPLRQEYNLGFEYMDKMVRLVVFHHGIEKGCRKVKLNILQQFTANEHCNLFKGRLQLHKKRNEIIVLFKKEIIGNIYIRQFETCLNKTILPESVR